MNDKESIVDTTINIQDTKCWRCGVKFKNGNRTTHHGIPSCLKPKRNITVPLCVDCHEELNSIDYSVLKQFSYKIHCDMKELTDMVSRLTTLLDNVSIMQEKLDSAMKKVKE